MTASHGAFFETIRQQLAARAAGLCVEALEKLGTAKNGALVIRCDGDRITYGIAPQRVGWDQIIVLGSINVTGNPAE